MYYLTLSFQCQLPCLLLLILLLISLKSTEQPAPLQFGKTTIYPGFLAAYLCSASLLLFFFFFVVSHGSFWQLRLG
jgi:hypothetical protein